jgi:hypothetical protein
MNVDPAYATAIQLPNSNKVDEFAMGNRWGVRYALVFGQELLASSTIPDQQFSVDQIVADNLIVGKKSSHFMRIRRSAGKRSNPDRGVDQDH